FDTSQRNLLYPFTYTRAIADIRVGILTIRERWEKLTKQKVYILTAPYLQTAYASLPPGENRLINASIIADENLTALIMNLRLNEAIVKDGEVIAGVLNSSDEWSTGTIISEKFRECILYDLPLKKLIYPWHIFQLNDDLIRSDFALITANRSQQAV